jgi:hypothetical protein
MSNVQWSGSRRLSELFALNRDNFGALRDRVLFTLIG